MLGDMWSCDHFAGKEPNKELWRTAVFHLLWVVLSLLRIRDLLMPKTGQYGDINDSNMAEA